MENERPSESASDEGMGSLCRIAETPYPVHFNKKRAGRGRRRMRRGKLMENERPSESASDEGMGSLLLKW
jgi:hypothetical protein